MSRDLDVLVWSASGYVAGEALRLIDAHPRLRLVGAISHSCAGQPIRSVFPHLDHRGEFDGPEVLSRLAEQTGPLAILGCGPHGRSAPGLAAVLSATAARDPFLVDLSADFRHDAETFEALYGGPHTELELLGRSACALPELVAGLPARIMGHPGCFTTAVTLGCAPLAAAGLCGPDVHVSAVTGSTGSGRTPKAGTHHPTRHGNMWGYKPLAHRHAPEMSRLLSALGEPVSVRFAPHSGPFARGIAATCFSTLSRPTDTDALRAIYRDFYADAPLVRVVDTPPTLADVVGTARCAVSICSDGDTAVVQVVIDNLLKGAAAGGVQWINRAMGWPDDLGLETGPLPWS